MFARSQRIAGHSDPTSVRRWPSVTRCA